MTFDERSIRELYAKWFSAMERGDVECILSLVTHDVILKGPDSPALLGKPALRKALEAFHAQFSETVSYSLEEVEVAGEWAFTRISEETTLRANEGGEAVVMSGMHLAVLRRSDGVWKVYRDISSLNTRPLDQ